MVNTRNFFLQCFEKNDMGDVDVVLFHELHVHVLPIMKLHIPNSRDCRKTGNYCLSLMSISFRLLKKLLLSLKIMQALYDVVYYYLDLLKNSPLSYCCKKVC